MELRNFKRDESPKILGMPLWVIFGLSVFGQAVFVGGLIYIGLHFLAKSW